MMSSSFLSDNPLSNPDEDELGYAPFASALAQSISKSVPSDGLVVALYGPWGSGKTTIINFVLYELNKLEEAIRPIISRFNPWLFSGRDDLAKLLLAQLRSVLGDKDYGEVKQLLADLADLTSVIPNLPGKDVGKLIAKKLRGEPDLISKKDKVDQLLRASTKPILIVIDDIDRLDSNEIQDLFRTVKAVANFPNVTYLLAFDVAVVSKALEQGFTTSASDYLEKIIQVPFTIPHPDKAALRRLLFSRLDTLLTQTPSELFDKRYWTNVYFSGIDDFIITPRHTSRLYNALRATYPAVEGEVNPIDFIALEAIRVFSPEVYRLIPSSADLLTGTYSYGTTTKERTKEKDIFDDWLNKASDDHRIAVKNILLKIFPRFSSAYGGTLFSYDFLKDWRKNLRACSPDLFATYFRFTLSPDSISQDEIMYLLKSVKNADDFSDALIKLAGSTRSDGSTRVSAVLERLEDYTAEDISESDIPKVVEAFFKVGDVITIKQDEGKGLFNFGNDLRIARILHQLLSRLNIDRRFDILKATLSGAEAVSLAVSEVISFGQQHGRFGSSSRTRESDRTVTIDQLDQLEDIMLGRIRSSASNGSLINAPNFKTILTAWKEWSGSNDEIREWVKEITATDEGLIRFLSHFGTTQRAQSIGDHFVRTHYRLDPLWIKEYIDPEDIIDRARELAKKEIGDEKEEDPVKQFITEYDIRSRGEDPNARPRY